MNSCSPSQVDDVSDTPKCHLLHICHQHVQTAHVLSLMPVFLHTSRTCFEPILFSIMQPLLQCYFSSAKDGSSEDCVVVSFRHFHFVSWHSWKLLFSHNFLVMPTPPLVFLTSYTSSWLLWTLLLVSVLVILIITFFIFCTYGHSKLNLVS